MFEKGLIVERVYITVVGICITSIVAALTYILFFALPYPTITDKAVYTATMGICWATLLIFWSEKATDMSIRRQRKKNGQ